MTLQNGLIEGGKVHLWTDTLLLDSATGRALCVAPKVFRSLFDPWAASLAMLGNPTYHLIVDSIGRAEPRNADQLLDAAQLALMDYAADGSVGRLLLACCFDGPQLFGISSDTVMGVPFAAYSFDHYLAPSRPGDTRKAMLADMPSIMADQVTGTFDWASPTLNTAPYKVGGQIIETIVSADGVEQREVVLPGEAGEALVLALGETAEAA